MSRVKLRVGVDIDGVLADFNDSFIKRIIDVTGKDLFPPRPFAIPTWDYPEVFGYSTEEIARVWVDIKTDPMFWSLLPPYPETRRVLDRLAMLQQEHDADLYFITARPGKTAKRQTEQWLVRYSWMQMLRPTVLISSLKGRCASALDLDVYIDDRCENARDVASTSLARSFLLDRPWNQSHVHPCVIRVNSVLDFMAQIEALAHGITAPKAA